MKMEPFTKGCVNTLAGAMTCVETGGESKDRPTKRTLA